MNEDRIVASKDFTNAPLCLSGRGVTKVFGMGEKKTVAVDHVDFDFHVGEFVSIVGLAITILLVFMILLISPETIINLFPA